jgi:glycerophosphoryl diester phosphodiesterase
MLIYAHRGSAAVAPENTLRAFQKAIDDGADGIEFDVHATADGIPVIIHDRELERTTNGHGHVDAVAYDALRKLDAGDGEHVPTLREVTALAGDRLRLYVELKQRGAEQAVLHILQSQAQTDWIIGSFDHHVLRQVRKLSPEAELWVISQSASAEVIDVAGEISATTVSLWSEATSPAAAERLFAADLDLVVWTVNDVTVAKQARLLGASAICTDDPKSLRHALDAVNGQRRDATGRQEPNG